MYIIKKMKTNLFEYFPPKKRFKLIIGNTLFIFGIFFFFFAPFQAVLFIAVGFVMIKIEGIQIDIKNKKYRIVRKVLFWNFGKWIKNENFDYISVHPQKTTSSFGTYIHQTNVDSVIYKLNVFYEHNRHITFLLFKDKNDALKIGELIADFLKIDIVDNTVKGEPRWITKKRKI